LSATVLILAAHFLTGSILTLVMPLALLGVILFWYALLWRRGAGG
jgi:hypothetical protein